jgi:glycosyltransferase involved in cell wall biosynthesis
MKIAIVSPVFPPYRGGIGSAAEAEAKELASRGHDVSVFVPHPRQMASHSSAAGEKFQLYELTPFIQWGNAAFLPQLFWRVKNFNVVHLHYPFFGGAEVVNCCFRRRHGESKLAVTYHHDVVGKGWLGKFFRWHTKHCMPKIMRTADKIIVSSFDYASNSNLKEIFAEQPEKFSELPFGVDENKFSPSGKDGELLRKHDLTSNDKIVLLVGGLDRPHYFKGVEILLKAKIQVPEAKFILVGDGDLRPRYERMAENIRVKDKIIFAGAVAREELSKYYNLADVVVLPSIDQSEAFGIVLIEAAACGKPVIASNLPGVRSVVDYGINGFTVEPGNVRQLADKINDLLYNNDLLRQFGQNGRTKVLEKYSLEKMGDNLEKIFTGLK